MKLWAIAIILGISVVAAGCGKARAPLTPATATPPTTAISATPGGTASAVPTGVASGTAQSRATPGATNPAAAAPAGSVTKVVDTVRPAVVRVEASGQAQNVGPFGPSGGTAQGSGTGIILDDQGHILTNNHVVTLEGSSVASSLQVTLANGKTVNAKVVGRDDQTDLAVMQVSSSDLSGTSPIQWAEPNSVVVGEPVVAIGYALDLGGEPTVTTGVVSATNRAIDETNATISGAIQTDAAINPGNSGGPLVDMSGRLIGINTAGLAGTSQQPTQGLNFAISAATAKPVADDLIAHGQVTRGYMGVRVTNITPELAQSSNLPVTSGAGVGGVTPGSPAAQAGIQPGDIISKVGDTKIQNVGDLTIALTQNGPGSKAPVTYYRGGSQHTTDVTLGSRPATG